MEHANKFKVGDSVVLNAPARITGTDKENAHVVFATGGSFVIPQAALVEAGPEPSKYTAIKKGDKFRVNKDDCCGGFRNGDVFVAVRDGECDVTFYDNEGDLRLINREQVTFVDDFGDPWDYKPALKIEAGKFYRTRDGLKVGPVSTMPVNVEVDREGRKHAWYARGYGSYDETGAWLGGGGNHNNDLIAEWTESKTKGCSAAEVDNLRDEYGPFVGATAAQEPKFKAGDRVVFVTDSPAYGASHTDGFLVVRSVFPDGDVKCSYPGRGYDYTQVIHHDDLELAPEPDATLSVATTADTRELDAEIDRIKRKIKKLSKKARKLGIALDYDLAA